MLQPTAGLLHPPHDGCHMASRTRRLANRAVYFNEQTVTPHSRASAAERACVSSMVLYFGGISRNTTPWLQPLSTTAGGGISVRHQPSASEGTFPVAGGIRGRLAHVGAYELLGAGEKQRRCKVARRICAVHCRLSAQHCTFTKRQTCMASFLSSDNYCCIAPVCLVVAETSLRLAPHRAACTCNHPN
jgi:hypothetical protein